MKRRGSRNQAIGRRMEDAEKRERREERRKTREGRLKDALKHVDENGIDHSGGNPER